LSTILLRQPETFARRHTHKHTHTDTVKVDFDQFRM
jgi:hypothetical protein